MYAQSWTNILDLTVPFPGRAFVDVTREMHEQGYTPQVMFQIAEEFFLSINMTALPTDFWLESVLEKPPHPERQLLCQVHHIFNSRNLLFSSIVFFHLEIKMDNVYLQTGIVVGLLR